MRGNFQEATASWRRRGSSPEYMEEQSPEYAGQKREKESVRTEKRKEPSRFEEVVCGPLRCNALLDYLKGRGIPAEIARAECEEVRFWLYGKRYFAVGFRNMGGGYELRTRFMKWCLPPKDISRHPQQIAYLQPF